MQRNWAEIHRNLDRDLREWSLESLHSIYLRFGCAIVRNAIDRMRLAELEELATGIYARKPVLHISDLDFSEETRGGRSLFELIADPLFKELRNAIFEGQNYSIHSGACRRIQGSESNFDWQQPLALHLDSQYHPFAFTLNHWIPFQDSGGDIAGIQFLPVDYRATRMFCRFTGHPQRSPEEFNFHYFPADCLNPERIDATFGDGCLFQPRINAGDVILLSNWIVHGTYRTNAMKRGRMNVELRFIGECIDIAGLVSDSGRNPS